LQTPFMGSYDESIVANKLEVRPPEGVLQLVRGCVAGQVDGMSAQVSAVTRCPDRSWISTSGPNPRFDELTPQFTWLVSVGGVTVRKFRPAPGEPPAQGFVEIYGGLAVPFFVIVLAFIGGAVSLSRRIPEYQRRSELHYVPNEKEPAMQPFQAREHVVFQIMQLTSAPFLAMATWYVVSPSTVASAACLAFGTGFASEPLLLMIRGMVEGIRPEGARIAGTPGGAAGKGAVAERP
jgi:hypothetical protein